MRHRIVLGVRSAILQEMLLSKSELTTKKAEQICLNVEATKLQAREVKGKEVNGTENLKKVQVTKSGGKECSNETF